MERIKDIGSLTELIKNRIELFAGQLKEGDEQGERILKSLNKLLSIELDLVKKQDVSEEYVQEIIKSYPELKYRSLTDACNHRNIDLRPRMISIIEDKCECGEYLTGNTCPNCGKVEVEKRSRNYKTVGKGKDSLRERIESFHRDLSILMGTGGLPDHIEMKLANIAKAITTLGGDINKPETITNEMMRQAFYMNNLQSDYRYCTTVRIRFTGEKLTPLESEEKKLMEFYYARALQPLKDCLQDYNFNKKGINKKPNLWSFPSIIALIINSSTRLKKRHMDLFNTLPRQNAVTETNHIHIWDSLTMSEKWIFE